MKKIFLIILALLTSGCSEIKPVVTEVPPPPPKKRVLVSESKLPADKLQELFFNITSGTTKEEIEAYAAANDLYLNKDKIYYAYTAGSEETRTPTAKKALQLVVSE